VHLVIDRYTRAASRKEISLRVDVPTGVAVTADRAQLEEVLSSLLQNALECCKPSGTIELTGKAEDGRALITVRDSGAAIPDADLAHVFDHFHKNARSRALKSGTGLALPIVKGLVETSGGRIWAESDGKTGAAFRFTLPLAAMPAPASS
jgi:two-component system, chemotaxis family, CheB/CheR fusion protein